MHSDHLPSIWNFLKKTAFFCGKSSFWSAILDDVVVSLNEVIAGSILPLMLCPARASTKMRNHISCFDQDVAFTCSNDSILEKKSNTAKKIKKHSFHPSWQSKRAWFLLVLGLSVSTDSDNYKCDLLQRSW